MGAIKNSMTHTGRVSGTSNDPGRLVPQTVYHRILCFCHLYVQHTKTNRADCGVRKQKTNPKPIRGCLTEGVKK